MRIALRILLGYFLVVGIAAWFLLNVFMQEVKPGVRSTMEDTLADTANLLAELVAQDVKSGNVGQSALFARIEAIAQRKVDARIDGYVKNTLSYQVYITDARGIVIFDSRGTELGKDYSRWNDVYLTLRGKYGARSTRLDPNDEDSTVMHVAAPVRDGEQIIGVLTIAKPNSTVQKFIERGQQVMLERGAVLLTLSLLVGFGFAIWLSRSLGKLMHYIAEVEAGRKVALPAMGKNEFGTLGRALESMRDKLEGKEYVEEVMHTLAHELRSPIAAIQGAAELLREDMPDADRKRFLATILSQNLRQKQLIDKLLALVRVEKQQRLGAPERIELPQLVALAGDDAEARLAARGLRLDIAADNASLQGDPLLLRQAIGNLVDNAADFAPAGSHIRLAAVQRGDAIVITVCDDGPGIPEFARDRLFDRFYSLPRPDGARSTGLGLPFVREVLALHRGSASVANQPGGGTCATLELPAA
jgi:two-component system sensor histidine kinase CreC